MLIPLHWLSTLQALALLAVGGALLAALLPLDLRPQPRTWLLPALAVLGLWIIAAALSLLKNRVLLRGHFEGDPNFMVLRNAESLAWVCVPLALAALLQPRLARVFAAALGFSGLGLIAVLAWAGFESAGAEGSFRIAVLRIPTASLLARDGNLSAARWLWCAGSVLIAIPTARDFWRLISGLRGATGEGLGLVLLGLALTSAAMAIFWWHAGDVRHRDYTTVLMEFIACAAPLLVLGEGRIASARWARNALGALSLVIALWMLFGAFGVESEDGYQELADITLSLLLVLLLWLIPPVLALHLAVRAIPHALRRWKASGRDSLRTKHLE